MTRAEIIRRVEALEPAVSNAFIASVNRITSRVVLAELADAIERQDAESVINLTGLRIGTYSDLAEELRGAFIKGGQFVTEKAPRAIGFDFDITNPRVGAWVQQNSSELITAINEDQRTLIRNALGRAATEGQNPRTTALELVGRVDRASGRRAGGLIGLTNNQAEFVVNARVQLESGDPTLMRQYLTRKARDRRYDAQVLRAIEAGEPVKDARFIAERYSDRLLKVRGDTIARTETIKAFNAGEQEALQQAIDEGHTRRENIIRVWSSSGDDGRTRDSHLAMDGQEVGLDEAFVNPMTGSRMMYAGDTSLGAGPEDVINCRCAILQRVDWERL